MTFGRAAADCRTCAVNIVKFRNMTLTSMQSRFQERLFDVEAGAHEK